MQSGADFQPVHSAFRRLGGLKVSNAQTESPRHFQSAFAIWLRLGLRGGGVVSRLFAKALSLWIAIQCNVIAAKRRGRKV